MRPLRETNELLNYPLVARYFCRELLSGGALPYRGFSGLIFRFLLADLFIGDKRDQGSQGVIHAFGIGEMCRNVGIKQDHLLKGKKIAFCDRAISMVYVNRMGLIRSQVIFSTHALFSLEIVFRKHVVVRGFGNIIRLLHIIFFRMESLYDN